MKKFSIEEWKEKRILRNTAFYFHNLQDRTVFYVCKDNRYMIEAELDNYCNIGIKMTAIELAAQTWIKEISKLY